MGLEIEGVFCPQPSLESGEHREFSCLAWLGAAVAFGAFSASRNTIWQNDSTVRECLNLCFFLILI